jgi:hypothetical protein
MVLDDARRPAISSLPDARELLTRFDARSQNYEVKTEIIA